MLIGYKGKAIPKAKKFMKSIIVLLRQYVFKKYLQKAFVLLFQVEYY